MTRLQKLTRDIDANLLYLTSLDKASHEAVELRTKTAALIMDRATLTIGQEQEEVDATVPKASYVQMAGRGLRTDTRSTLLDHASPIHEGRP